MCCTESALHCNTPRLPQTTHKDASHGVTTIATDLSRACSLPQLEACLLAVEAKLVFMLEQDTIMVSMHLLSP